VITSLESVAVQDDLLHALTAAFPPLSPLEAKLGRLLYRELLKGKPVYRERLATMSWLPSKDVVTALSAERIARLLLYDTRQRIVGFAGLSLDETPFAIDVGTQTLYTWCAWDGLFLPEMIDRTVALRTTCPKTQRRIQLTVRPDLIESVDPPETVLSFVVPNASVCQCGAEASRGDFCDRVAFFASRDAADQWTARDSDSFVLTLEDAFQLARAFNAARFGTQGTPS